MAKKLTDEEVLKEIEKLEKDSAVKLGRSYVQKQLRMRKKLYQLRWYQKKGLECAGCLND